MRLWLHRLCIDWSLNYVCNHLWDASIAAPLVHVSVHRVRFTIIQEMRLLPHRLCVYQWSIIIQRMRLWLYFFCRYWSIGDGLQSFMGYLYGCTAYAFINLLGTIYNHPWDASMAAPLVHVSVHRIRFRIIMEYVYDCTACACIGLLGTVYNHPKDASTSAPLVHISFYW